MSDSRDPNPPLSNPQSMGRAHLQKHGNPINIRRTKSIIVNDYASRSDSDSHGDALANVPMVFDYLIEHAMWDGTKQTLSVNFDELLTPDQQISQWEVLVQRRTITVGTFATGRLPCIGLDIVYRMRRCLLWSFVQVCDFLSILI